MTNTIPPASGTPPQMGGSGMVFEHATPAAMTLH